MAFKTALIRAYRLFASRWPRASFSLGCVFAWLTRPLGRGVPEERIAAMLPELGAEQLSAARRQTWATFLKDQALDAALERGGPRALHPVVTPSPAIESLRPPLIIASVHVGSIAAVGAAFDRLPGDVLVLHRGRFAPRPGVMLEYAGTDVWGRARAFHHAIAALRSGSFVFIALDGADSSTVEAPMLGGTVTLARGAFALARITGTPIVPVAARWRGSRVELTCGEPVAPAPEEQAMAAAAAEWLGGYLSQFPGEVNLPALEILRLPPSR